MLQAVNALNVVDLFEWADAQDIPIQLWVGRGLDQYNDFRILPHAVRNAFREGFERYFARKDNRDLAAVRENVGSILAEMDANDFSDHERRQRVVNFMAFVNDMDRSRRLSFKAIGGDTHAAIVAYLGEWDTRTRFA